MEPACSEYDAVLVLRSCKGAWVRCRTGTAKMLCTVEAGTELRVHMDHSRSAGQAKRFLFWSKLHSIGNVANKNVS